MFLQRFHSRKIKTILTCLLIGCVLTGCSKGASEQESTENQSEQEATDNLVESSDSVVVWGVPAEYLEEAGLNETLGYFNTLLQEEGCDYTLRFVGISEENYYSSAERLLDGGDIDILSLGFTDDYSLTGSADTFIKSGKLYDLTDALEDPEGQALYTSVNAELWEGITYNQHIYAIPNQFGRNGNAYVALKKAEFGDSITEIDNFYDFLEILEQDETCQTILWDDSFSHICPSLGYEYYNGILVDIETGECYSPYELETVRSLFALMHELYTSGKLIDAVSLTDRKDVIRGEEYSVLISSDWTSLKDEISDDYCFLQLPYTVQSRTSGSTGINAASNKKDQALDLLSKLYSDEQYANALIYGEENSTYEIQDGLVYNKNGEPYYQLYKSMYLGIYDNLLCSDYDEFLHDRKATKNALIGTEAERNSPTRGFFVDDSEISDLFRDYLAQEEKLETVWKNRDFDTRLAEITEEFRNSDQIIVVETIEEQLQEEQDSK